MARRILIIIFALTFFTRISYAQNLRVISLYPGHSDNIFALSGDLIALSENDDENLLPDLPRLSIKVNPEKILSLNPDVVVTRTFAERINPNLYKVLKNSGIKLFL